jgi:hypothetical protein
MVAQVRFDLLVPGSLVSIGLEVVVEAGRVTGPRDIGEQAL